MALTLNKKILPAIVADAHASGLITGESSSSVALYQISHYWRLLFEKATRHSSDLLPQWSEKEHAAAKVITSALLFLSMEGCRDVERLLSQVVGVDAKTYENKKITVDNANSEQSNRQVDDLKKTIKNLRLEIRNLKNRVAAQSNEIRGLRSKHNRNPQSSDLNHENE